MSISQIKQIPDEEKIEIMQHYINGGEVECKVFPGTDWSDWSVVQPSWAWNDCFYRKRIYDYPLYFEYDKDSEKFIVEFTGLSEGTVVQKTYSNWNIGHFDNEWYPHTDKDFWKEVDKPKELNEIDNLKSKFQTGNYICVGNKWFGVSKWVKIQYPILQEKVIIDYKLIHKKHVVVLDAYLKDKNIEIEYCSTCNGWITIDGDFLLNYDELEHYRIKEPESQIVYECYRTDKKTRESEIISKLLTDKMLKILENENRTQYTYHKTGRSFEIKLGDK